MSQDRPSLHSVAETRRVQRSHQGHAGPHQAPAKTDHQFVTLFSLAALLPILPQILLHTTGIQQYYAILVAAVFVLQAIVLTWTYIQCRARLSPTWVMFAIVFGIAQSTTQLVTLHNHGSIEILDIVNSISMLLGIILYAGFASTFRTTVSSLRALIAGVLVLAAVAAGYNLLINASRFGEMLVVHSSYQLNFSSFFPNRNQFGSFIFVTIAIHILYISMAGIRRRNVALFILQGISLFGTMSRGALLASAVFLLALLMSRFRKNHTILVFGFGTVVLLALMGAVDLFLGTPIASVFLRLDAGTAGRADLWSTGLSVWQESSILFGTGLYTGLSIAQSMGMGLTEFHSFFVETLVTGGIVQLVLLVFMIAMVYRHLASSLTGAKYLYIYRSALLGVAALASFESISLLTIGFVGTLYTLTLVTLPLLLANVPPGHDNPVVIEQVGRSRIHRPGLAHPLSADRISGTTEGE